MLESTVTIDWQIDLPREVRDALGLAPGDKVRFSIREKDVAIRRVGPINRLFGAIQHHGPPLTLTDFERGIVCGATSEFSRKCAPDGTLAA